MSPLILVFLSSFILSLILTPIAARIGLRFNLADEPGGRRQHARRVARTGGLALYISFVVALLISQSLNLPRSDPNESTRLIGLLLGATVMFVFGLIDDRLELKPGWQFIAQLIASGLAIGALIIVERFNNPLSADPLTILPPWLYIPLTLFWLMGMMNTVNWLDGLDGLAAGISAIFSIILLLAMLQETATQQPQISLTPLPLALLGATLGFLPYNFQPARIFMGSSGALMLGFVLGAMGIIGGAKVATVLLILTVPILDVAWLIVSRLQHHRSPMQGGRDHLHFRLLDLGLSQRQIVIGYWLVSALFGALALLIETRIYKLLALGILGIITLGIMIALSKRSNA